MVVWTWVRKVRRSGRRCGAGQLLLLLVPVLLRRRQAPGVLPPCQKPNRAIITEKKGRSKLNFGDGGGIGDGIGGEINLGR